MHRRALAAVTLLVLVIIATAAILVAQREPERPPPNPPDPPSPTTLLVQVRDPALLALGSVLMGVDEGGRLDQLWWTPDWWIDQIGPQEVSAAELGRKPVPYVMQTVQNQTQVPVDDAWVMDRLAFAGLVDAVGGVRVDLPARTAYLSDTGTPTILEQGVQNLPGAQAADYVLDPSLRDEKARLARFQAVWDQILRRFPTVPEKARTLVVSMGALSKSTMTTDELAVYMSQAKALRTSGGYVEATVPLNPLNVTRVRPPQRVRSAFALREDRMGRRMAGLFRGYEVLDQPVARVQAVAVRSEDVETLRAQLVGRSWLTAWAGRTVAAQSSVSVQPDVPRAEVAGLEQALGVTPTEAELPWGQARVEVTVPVGS